MFSITVEHIFSASHAIRLPGDGLEPLHGHNWQVSVEVATTQLDEVDCVLDFHPLHAALVAICKPWHNAHLNDVSPFASADGTLAISPTAERVAEVIGRSVAEWLTEHHSHRVRLTYASITEAPGCTARWEPV